MSEQYPLLPEFSDEDRVSPRYHRRRSVDLKGRAKYQLKGAAAIMSRWPDHWTSLLTYWWIGLGMIAITTFLIYNTLFSIAQFQPLNTNPSKHANYKTIKHTSKSSLPLTVHMHVFVNNNEIADLNKYLPFVEIFSNKYKDLAFDFIIVANDTSLETTENTDETNNVAAMNSLWNNDANYGNLVESNSHIKIKYVTLSKYLKESPLEKDWENLPYQFIEFLVRAVSIWEKGGIAINPIIFTPQSPHPAYVEKFGSIVNNFRKRKSKKRNHEHAEPESMVKTKVILPKVNNIRDIIHAMESGVIDNPDQEILNAAESRIIDKIDKENIVRPNAETDFQNKKSNKMISNAHEAYSHFNVTSKETVNKHNEGHECSSDLLPMFFNYLFHRANTERKKNSDTELERERRSPTKNIIRDSNDIQIRNFQTDIKDSDEYKPMIVSARGIPKDNANGDDTKQTQKQDDSFELTVDIKGHLIATEIPCHAFVGNVFINAIHHDSAENLTDFIIKELSIFCKGLLASCVGIDVILV